MDKLSDLSCGDNSCIMGTKGGMATNAGCRCFRDIPINKRRKAHRAIFFLLKKVKEMRDKGERQTVELLKDYQNANLIASDLRAEIDRLKEKLKRQQGHHTDARAEQEEEAQKLWNDLYEDNERLVKENKQLRKAAEAYIDLVRCHQTQRIPSEALHRRLAAAHKILLKEPK